MGERQRRSCEDGHAWSIVHARRTSGRRKAICNDCGALSEMHAGGAWVLVDLDAR